MATILLLVFRLRKVVLHNPFVHQLELLLPKPVTGVAKQTSLETATVGQFVAARINFSSLLEGQVWTAFVSPKEQEFQALVANEETALVISPSGILRLRLTSEAYQRFGLVGKRLSGRQKGTVAKKFIPIHNKNIFRCPHRLSCRQL